MNYSNSNMYKNLIARNNNNNYTRKNKNNNESMNFTRKAN